MIVSIVETQVHQPLVRRQHLFLRFEVSDGSPRNAGLHPEDLAPHPRTVAGCGGRLSASGSARDAALTPQLISVAPVKTRTPFMKPGRFAFSRASCSQLTQT